MKESLGEKLFNLIKQKGKLTYGQMCEFVNQEGYKISYAERELRRYQETGQITHETQKSKRNSMYISAYTLPSNYVAPPPPPKYEIRNINGQQVAVLC